MNLKIIVSTVFSNQPFSALCHNIPWFGKKPFWGQWRSNNWQIFERRLPKHSTFRHLVPGTGVYIHYWLTLINLNSKVKLRFKSPLIFLSIDDANSLWNNHKRKSLWTSSAAWGSSWFIISLEQPYNLLFVHRY